MNNKTKDILDEVLDVVFESTTGLLKKNQTLSPSKEMKLLKMLMINYKYQRENFYNLIERGQDDH